MSIGVGFHNANNRAERGLDPSIMYTRTALSGVSLRFVAHRSLLFRILRQHRLRCCSPGKPATYLAAESFDPFLYFDFQF